MIGFARLARCPRRHPTQVGVKGDQCGRAGHNAPHPYSQWGGGHPLPVVHPDGLVLPDRTMKALQPIRKRIRRPCAVRRGFTGAVRDERGGVLRALRDIFPERRATVPTLTCSNRSKNVSTIHVCLYRDRFQAGRFDTCSRCVFPLPVVPHRTTSCPRESA